MYRPLRANRYKWENRKNSGQRQQWEIECVLYKFATSTKTSQIHSLTTRLSSFQEKQVNMIWGKSSTQLEQTSIAYIIAGSVVP